MEKVVDNYSKLTLELLNLLNQHDNKRDTIKQMINLIQEYTGFEAIGIRLENGDDYPFYCSVGFTETFIKKENFLAVSNYSGESQLACMCGYVISQSGKSSPFINDYGSFWTGSAEEFLKSVNQDILPPFMRNRCSKAGYETVAIIPIKNDDKIVGTLLLDDKRKNLINSANIKSFESIANILGMIYQRKRYEQELTKRNQELKELMVRYKKEYLQRLQSDKIFKISFEDSQIGMTICNTKGQFIKVNKAFCEMIGYSEEEVLKMEFKDIIHPEYHEESYKLFHKLLDRLVHVTNFEIQCIHKTGKIIWINLNIAMIANQDGKPLHLISHIENITDKKEVTDKLIRQKEELEYTKLKNLFFANLSHELKTPLNLSFSALQMLNLILNKMSMEDSAKIEKYVRVITKNNYRLLKLANNMVDITKIDAGAFKVRLQNIDIISVVKKVVDSVEEYIINKGRLFEFTTNVDHLITACDSKGIERIILNLLANAVKFTDEGDIIRIDINNQDGKVIIKVMDTGIGIKVDKQKIIFESFVQVDKSFTRIHEGSGLGLSIVKLLVELHGGSIQVNSEYGDGSEFIIELPVTVLSEDNAKEDKYEDNIDMFKVEFSDIYDF